MKTKTLILTAALSVAGLASSQAQVFSSNAVGYVNKTIESGGWTAITNPLDAGDNTIGALLVGLPDGTTIQKWVGDTFTGSVYTNIGVEGVDGWDDPSIVLNPGEGAFISNTTGQPYTITFVGEVMQGTGANALVNELPEGFSMVGSMVPQAGTLTSLSLSDSWGLAQDTAGVQVWDSDNQTYVGATFTFIGVEGIDGWDTDLPISVAESFFVQIPTGGATSWDREFSVN
jgi:hypothetical protein